MNKILKILLSFIILMGILIGSGKLLYSNGHLDPYIFDTLSVNIGDDTIFYNKYSESKEILDMVSDGEKSPNFSLENFSSEVDSIEIYFEDKLSRDHSYTIYSDNQSTYMYDESDYYKLSDKSRIFFISNPLFDSLYKYKIPSSVGFTQSGLQLVESSVDRWDYKKLDGNFYSSKMKDVESYDLAISDPSDEVTFTYGIEPLEVTVNDTDKLEGKYIDGSFSYTLDLPNTNGDYDFNVTAIWDNNDYTGISSINLKVNAKYKPTFTFDTVKSDLDVDTLNESDILKITVNNVSDSYAPYLIQDAYSNFEFYKVLDKYVGYIPYNYTSGNGLYTFEYGILDESGNKIFEEVKEIEFIPRDYKIQYLYISESTESSARSDEAYAEYNKYFFPAKYVSNPERYYTEDFIMPTTGILTTEFGERRFVNDVAISYNHNGLDIANGLGTDIISTNDGKVTLSMELILTGNTLIIDHGQGLFSIYLHMNERLVSEGDMVTRGETIGKMGTTGFSTGSHLHFSMSYYNVNIDPGYVIWGTPITKENYWEYIDN